jgi:hypothetical protein
MGKGSRVRFQYGMGKTVLKFQVSLIRMKEFTQYGIVACNKLFAMSEVFYEHGLQIGNIFFPLDGKEMLFLVITCLAGSDNITFYGSAATNDWDYMVHGEFFGGHLGVTIVTSAACEFSLPPGAGAEHAGCVAFPPDLFIGHVGDEMHYLFPLLTSSSS